MQPNVNWQAPCASRCDGSSTFAARTLPITEVDPGSHTITVSGNYAADPLAQPPIVGVASAGTRFRIFAPPGVETGRGVSGRGKVAGTLAAAVSGESSRCLYAGYRYESPLAGDGEWVNVGTASQPVLELQIKNRQKGKNFAGQHYTLHRHYDPVLMRFTSPDPAAAPFYNLFHYAGNNPAAFYDPDGLDPFRELKDMEDDAYYHSEDFDEDYFMSEKYKERSEVRRYERLLDKDLWEEAVRDGGAGFTYGVANGASFGIYGFIVPPETHAIPFGADPYSRFFHDSQEPGEFLGMLLITGGGAGGLRASARPVLSRMAATQTQRTVAQTTVVGGARGVNVAQSGVGKPRGSKSAPVVTKRVAGPSAAQIEKLRMMRREGGVVYLRTNVRTGREYVGRAKNWDRYQARKGEHTRSNGQIYKYRVLDRRPNSSMLEVAEESWMRRYGGPQRWGGPLENRRVQMNDARYRAAGGDIPWSKQR